MIYYILHYYVVLGYVRPGGVIRIEYLVRLKYNELVALLAECGYPTGLVTDVSVTASVKV